MPRVARAGSLLACLGLGACPAAATQIVFLDFVSDQDLGEIVYSLEEQQAIEVRLAEDFGAYDYGFTRIEPPAMEFSRVTFNADGVSGGAADDIDFRNLNHGDSARVNVHGMIGGSGQLPLTSANLIGLSSTIAAHEVGHLAGLRHSDAFGPIGAGVHDAREAAFFFPAYPGPTQADDTTLHVMASPGSVGQTIVEAAGDTFFGERSAIKLAYNEMGVSVTEQPNAHATAATAQPVVLHPVHYSNADPEHSVRALALSGGLDAPGETDLYAFDAAAGEIITLEIYSRATRRIQDPIDSAIRVSYVSGDPLSYYGFEAFNDDQFESLDSLILDLVLPDSASYVIEVSGVSVGDIGDYELFVYSLLNVPEPSSLLLVSSGLLILARRQKGRKHADFTRVSRANVRNQ